MISIDSLISISFNDKKHLKKVLSKFSKKKTNDEIFYNICFCICAPQTTFASNLKVINELISRDFYNKKIDILLLKDIVRPVRFLRKADFITVVKNQLFDIIDLVNNDDGSKIKREWLVSNIKGIGMKTASHFLRNQGIFDLAIIDTHVIKFLKCDLPRKKSEYITVESKFIKVAEKLGLSAAELDAYIWKTYSNTDWEDFKY